MGSIPLPALAVKSPQQIDPLEAAGRALSLRDLMQRGQLQQQAIQRGGIENEQAQIALNDQKSMTAAMHEWDGKDFDSLIPLVQKHGGSAQAVMGLKQNALNLKAKYSEIAAKDAETGEKNLTTLKGQNDMVAGAIKNAMSLPDEQLAQGIVATAQDLADKKLIDPQHLQMAQQIAQSGDPASMRKSLDFFRKSYMANSAQMDEAEKAATTREKNASAEKTELETNFIKQFGGMTPAMAESKYLSLQAKVNQGQPVSPADKAFMQAYEKNKTLVPAMRFQLNAGEKSNARSDKSYQFSSSQLDKVGQPIEQAVARFGRLQDTLNQSTPQADALVAPELLTVMAGGQGSGLRMNEAEISRVIGGRSNLESLKAALNKWQLDPTKALSITSAQRQQIRSLMNEVQSKLLKKQNILDQARQDLINADSPEDHRRIVANARKAMTDIDEGKAQMQTAPAKTDPLGIR